MKMTFNFKPQSAAMHWLMRLTIKQKAISRIALMGHKLTLYTHATQKGHPLAVLRLYAWRGEIQLLTDRCHHEINRLQRLLSRYQNDYEIKPTAFPKISLPADSEAAVALTQLLKKLDELLLLIEVCKRFIYKQHRTFQRKNQRYLCRIRKLMEEVGQATLPPIHESVTLTEDDRRQLPQALTAPFMPPIRPTVLYQIKQYQKEMQ